MTRSQQDNTRAKLAELREQPGFAAAFLNNGQLPVYGQQHRFPRLADTLEQLGRAGAEDFYRGDLAGVIARDLARVGSPVSGADLAAHRASLQDPLAVKLSVGTVYNQAPPTQGVASLLILAIYDRIRREGWSPDNAEGIHALVEATKQAFLQRDRPTVPVLTTDGRSVGRRHIVDGLTPVAIDQSGTIRCAVTGRTLFIAPGSPIDRANPGAAAQLNPSYRPALHQVVADHRQIETGAQS